MATILVVEDDPIIRQTVEYSLKRAGFCRPHRRRRRRSARDGCAHSPRPGAARPHAARHGRLRDRRADPRTTTRRPRSSWSPRSTPSATRCAAWTRAPTTTSPSRSRWRSCSHACARTCAACAPARRSPTTAPSKSATWSSSPRASASRSPASRSSCASRSSSCSSRSPAARGQLATRQILAEEVWGYEHLPSSRTIDVHIRRLRQAVEDPSEYVYVHTVHGMGYRFEAIAKSNMTEDSGVRR